MARYKTFNYFTSKFYLRIVFHLSSLSFGIESESRLPFFIANGADDCAIAVEFRRFAVNCARLLAICKAALALRRRGGESLELRAKTNLKQHFSTFPFDLIIHCKLTTS